MARSHKASQPVGQNCTSGPSRWRVTERRANRSAFNGYHWTPSDYSQLTCIDCGAVWRSKSKYVDDIPDGHF